MSQELQEEYAENPPILNLSRTEVALLDPFRF